MARTFTLAQLRTKVRERADMEESNFIDDTELNGYISASYADLYDQLIKSGILYFATEETFTPTAGVQALAADYYGTIGVEYQVTSDEYDPLFAIMPSEVPMFEKSTGTIGRGFIVTGSNLVIYPKVSSGTYRHRYIPAPADLTSDSDTVDGVAGWEEFIVLDAAIKCLDKEESPTGALERRRDRIEDRIQTAAENRYWGVGQRVVDVYDNPSQWRLDDWRRRW